MDTIKNTNSESSAFASTAIGDYGDYHQSGLTKLEYFAGMAMRGLLSRDIGYNRVTEDAVKLAKMLLDELAKENI